MFNIKISKPKRRAFKASSSGAALIEYGMLVGLISVLSIGAVLSLGEEVADTFSTTKSALELSTADNDSQEEESPSPYVMGENVLTNGDASQGSAGWTTTAGTMEVRSEDGNSYFHLTGDPVTIQQKFPIPENLWSAIDESRIDYKISYRIRNSESSSSPYVLVRFYSEEELINNTNSGSNGQRLGQWGTQGNWEDKPSNLISMRPNARWGVVKVSRVSGNQYMDFDELSISFSGR